MAAAPHHPELHELVDQLSPAQADAVRAVIAQLVNLPKEQSDSDDAADESPRELAFIGAGASGTGITHRMDELLADGFGRD